jgi:hypothetical protein
VAPAVLGRLQHRHRQLYKTRSWETPSMCPRTAIEPRDVSMRSLAAVEKTKMMMILSLCSSPQLPLVDSRQVYSRDRPQHFPVPLSSNSEAIVTTTAVSKCGCQRCVNSALCVRYRRYHTGLAFDVPRLLMHKAIQMGRRELVDFPRLQGIVPG